MTTNATTSLHHATAALRLGVLLLIGLLALSAHPVRAQIAGDPEGFDFFGFAVASGDFDGDGFDDLAVGVSDDKVNGQGRGAVNVIYGTENRLDQNRNQYWFRASGETGDLFGWALAAGDFNGDGFDDLAIGEPGDNVNGVINAGSIGVLLGSSQGLVAEDYEFFNQGNLPGALEINDAFGSSLAAGDFDGDGRDDLAVGVPLEDIGTTVNAGSVLVIYGSSGALNEARAEYFEQDNPEEGDLYGSSVASGDFNGDGRDDLAVGAPFEEISSMPAVGRVSFFYGTPSGLSTSGAGDFNLGDLGVQRQSGERFGDSLASGDFDGDGSDDLAVGAPFRDVGSELAAGAVSIIFADGNSGLAADGAQFWSQGNLPGLSEESDHFGHSLASGDFDDNGFDDLAVGVPGEDIGSMQDVGTALVIYGASGGLTANRSEIFVQAVPEGDDLFGRSVTSGDFNGDGRDDIAVGAPFEDIGSVSAAGQVSAFYGRSTGIGTGGQQHFWQGRSLTPTSGEDGPVAAHAFALEAAYPNPFTGRTTLAYVLSSAQEVRVAVYDVLGREVAVLAEGIEPAGEQEVTFDAAGLPSGLYVVRLTAGDQVRTQRVTVVR